MNTHRSSKRQNKPKHAYVFVSSWIGKKRHYSQQFALNAHDKMRKFITRMCGSEPPRFDYLRNQCVDAERTIRITTENVTLEQLFPPKTTVHERMHENFVMPKTDHGTFMIWNDYVG